MSVTGVANGHRDASTVTQNLLKNDSNGGWLIQKYGGTSVGKLPLNIAEDIVR